MDNNKKNNRKGYWLVLLLTTIGVIIDQATKFYIHYQFQVRSCANCLRQLLNVGGNYGPFKVVVGRGLEIIPHFFYVTEVHNTGGAWGIFSSHIAILTLISFTVILFLIYMLFKEKHIGPLAIAYYSLLIAGIAGNFIDRLFNGYVIDFLNFYLLGYDYPVFNIADIFIVVGIMLLIFELIRGEINDYHSKRQ